MRSRRLPVARQVVIAAIVGTTGGAVAGLWSVAPRPTTAAAVQTPLKAAVRQSSPATPDQNPASTPVRRHEATAVASPVQAVPAAAKASPAVPAATKASASLLTPIPAEGGDVLVRARALAQRPDVKALVALRESVVRRAAQRGETESAASKQELAELDRYLQQARLLRLKLDAEEFKHAETAVPRPLKR
jgi:hypothetical protein